MRLEKDYLNYRNNCLHYYDINLLELVEKYGNPLKAGYVDIIREKVLHLKECFKNSIKKFDYKGKYIYANANKASYYSENVITAGHYADMIETSSYFDLLLVERILSKKIVEKKTIICNGIKNKQYLNKIIELANKNYNILNIIDNIEEFNYFVNADLKYNMELGLRVNLINIYSKSEEIVYDRFGLTEKELDYCLENYLKNSKLNITTLHYHQRSSEYDEEKNFINLEKVFKIYAKLKNKNNNIINLNIGGGSPYDKIREYNYQDYTDKIISFIKELAIKLKVDMPNIIQENGRYTVSDSCFNIYKVENVKEINNDLWYVINGSIMTSVSNTWALNEEFLVLPINLMENKLLKCKLAGDTCDCDDTYYQQTKEKYVLLPEIKEGQTLYIGFFGIGAYQEILSGIGGIHHCLNAEENDLIIYKKKNKNVFFKIRGAQSINHIFKRLNYKKKSRMKVYKKIK